jgi:hypothetical protein
LYWKKKQVRRIKINQPFLNSDGDIKYTTENAQVIANEIKGEGGDLKSKFKAGWRIHHIVKVTATLIII